VVPLTLPTLYQRLEVKCLRVIGGELLCNPDGIERARIIELATVAVVGESDLRSRQLWIKCERSIYRSLGHLQPSRRDIAAEPVYQQVRGAKRGIRLCKSRVQSYGVLIVDDCA